MRFFTIDTRDHGFIELVDVNDTYWISLQRDGAIVAGIPLSPFFSDGAKQVGLNHIREGLITQGESGSTVTVTKEPRDWRQRRRRLDTSAVVLVRTPPGSEGLALTQSSYDEYVENGRVHRRYHEFMEGGEMPPGITLLASNANEEVPMPTHPEFLLELLPKAAFRIVQLGESRGPGTLSVRWSGQELVVKEFRPSWSPGDVAETG
jgi:hypothetical protein